MTPISFLRDVDDFARIPSALWKETDARWKKYQHFQMQFYHFFEMSYLSLFGKEMVK